MVNGWTLKKSQYPLQKVYLDLNDTKEKRHAIGGFSGFKNAFQQKNDYGQFVNTWNNAGYKVSSPPSAYHIFGRLVTDYVKQYVATQLLQGTPVAQDEKLVKAINSCIY